QIEMPGLELKETYLVPTRHESSGKCKYGSFKFRKMSGIHILEISAASPEEAQKKAFGYRCLDIHMEDGCNGVLIISKPTLKKVKKHNEFVFEQIR
ncbi:MAG: hypothetical protein WC894_00875, partial [Patescibacteria group bacterium]